MPEVWFDRLTEKKVVGREMEGDGERENGNDSEGGGGGGGR